MHFPDFDDYFEITLQPFWIVQVSGLGVAFWQPILRNVFAVSKKLRIYPFPEFLKAQWAIWVKQVPPLSLCYYCKSNLSIQIQI